MVGRKIISKEMGIPYQFLGKIAQRLARAGFMEIIQGAHGGYRLVMPPEQVTLLDVVEAATGELFLNDCVLEPESCRRSPTCSVHGVWQRARDQLRSTLREATFESLLNEEWCMSTATGASAGKEGDQ